MERYEKLQKLVEMAEKHGSAYENRMTMLMDLELCDDTFKLDLDDMLGEWDSECEYFWIDLSSHIDREAKSFNGWIPVFATEVKHSKYEDKAKELIEEGFYSVPQVIGFVYDLYQDCQINEPEEEYLYNLLDPEEKYNECYEYWCAWPFANPLTT